MEWCPTDQMLADIVTKPLMGDLFNNIVNTIVPLINVNDITK